MLMSDLTTHRSLACKAHLNVLIENALYKVISITITIPCSLLQRRTTSGIWNGSFSLDEHHSLRYVSFSHNVRDCKHKGNHKEKWKFWSTFLCLRLCLHSWWKPRRATASRTPESNNIIGYIKWGICLSCRTTASIFQYFFSVLWKKN